MLKKLQLFSLDDHKGEAFNQSKILAVIRIILRNMGNKDQIFLSYVIDLCLTSHSYNFELIRKELGHLMSSIYESVLILTPQESVNESHSQIMDVFNKIETSLSHVPEQNSKNTADTSESLLMINRFWVDIILVFTTP